MIIGLFEGLLIEFSIENAIHILDVLGPFLGGLSTLALAYLYLQQHSEMSEQSEILKEQQKISRFEHTPHLVGPFDMEYRPDDDELLMKVLNTGRGPARRVQFYISFDLPREPNLDIKAHLLQSTRKGKDNYMEPAVIYPGESEIEFKADMSSDPMVMVEENGELIEESYNIEEVLEALKDTKGERVTMEFLIMYKDEFGEREDPYGKEYISHGRQSVSFRAYYGAFKESLKLIRS